MAGESWKPTCLKDYGDTMSSGLHIEELRERAAPLDMTGDQFRSLGHDLVDRIADFLDTVRARPVTRAESPEEVRAALGATRALPEQGQGPEALLRDATNLLLEHSLFNGHPRFYGYITSSAAPIGMLADLLAAAVNANVGAWKLSPMATEIEAPGDSMARGVHRLPGRLRRSASERRQHGQSHVLPGRPRRAGRLGRSQARRRRRVRACASTPPRKLTRGSTKPPTWPASAQTRFIGSTEAARWT